jgi:hypothetical protein
LPHSIEKSKRFPKIPAKGLFFDILYGRLNCHFGQTAPGKTKKMRLTVPIKRIRLCDKINQSKTRKIVVPTSNQPWITGNIEIWELFYFIVKFYN